MYTLTFGCLTNPNVNVYIYDKFNLIFIFLKALVQSSVELAGPTDQLNT